MTELWASADLETWQHALARYPTVVEAQGSGRLPALDRWYREDLPALISGRSPGYVTRDELVRVTEWKMARGVWRPRNLVLVRSNEAGLVEETSRTALARVPDPAVPVAILSRLAGVGPATASAILSIAAPEIYPFFDELVANQVPGLAAVDFTAKYYARYADAVRERARELGHSWTPTMVERALWANSGGKVNAR